MRVNLVFQPGELCLCIFRLFIEQLLTDLTDADEMTDTDGDGTYHDVQQQEHEGTREETYPGVIRHHGHMLLNHEIAEEEAIVDAKNQQQVT